LELFGGLLLFVVILASVYLNQPQCPSCQQRGTVKWIHQRKDGRADQRFNDNYQTCSACGWVSEWEQQRQFQEASERERAHKKQKLAKEYAENQRKLTTLEAVPRSCVWLLKYVALADRRYKPEESKLIAEHVSYMFHELRQEEALAWADSLKPVVNDFLPTLATVREQGVEISASLMLAIEELANADGKATPAEIQRIDMIRTGLGLTAESVRAYELDRARRTIAEMAGKTELGDAEKERLGKAYTTIAMEEMARKAKPTCTACGWQASGGEKFCPNDGEKLTG